MPDEDIEAIAEIVLRGEDDYVLPEELVTEPVEPVAQPPEKNLAAQIAEMGMGQRLKLALRGNREARTILMRDPNRMVQRFLIQNPRLTDDEVIMMAKNRNFDREILGRIGSRKEWARNYQVRLALVTNPKTPLNVAISFVSTLLERDVRLLAKNKNIPAAVTGKAKRLMSERG